MPSTTSRAALPTLLAVLALAACSSGDPIVLPDSGPGPCAAQTCSGHGRCAALDGQPVCVCEAGYRAEALACLPEVDPCAGQRCSEHGTCAVAGGTALCVCAAGFHAVDLECAADVAGAECQGVTCSGHGTCVVVDGEPKAPLCQCADGYHLQGNTTCAADADPCAGQSCSGQGTCAVVQGAARCFCRDGFREVGLTCVVDSGTDAGVPGDTGPSLFVLPSTLSVSNQGRFMSYVDLSPLDGSGASHQLGRWLVKDVQAGTEVVLDPAVRIVCIGPCGVRAFVEWDQADQKMVRLTPRTESGTTPYVPGELVDLASGTRTALPSYDWLSRPLRFAPDLSWALVAKQTYGGGGAAISLAMPVTAAPQKLSDHCMDPSATLMDAATVGGTTYVAASVCTGPWDARVWELKAFARPGTGSVTLATGAAESVTATPKGVVYSLASQAFLVPFTGGTPTALGAGKVASVSPGGDWVALLDGTTSRLVSTANPSAPAVTLGTVRSYRWADAQTLWFTVAVAGTSESVIHRLAVGGATTVHGQTPNAVLLGRDCAVGLASPTSSGSFNLSVTDGTLSLSFTVREAVEAVAYRGTNPAGTSLGRGAFWGLGPAFALRGQLYFDVLRGGAPDPANGFYVVPVP
ncbi:MAG: hypothetical protein QM765_30860 [Myxococcales bacterium]